MNPADKQDEPGRDTLSAEERALAERLQALPRPQPSADLDRSILAAAHAPARRRPRPAFWGLGSAAAALLAIAVFWPLRFGTGPGEPAPADATPESMRMATAPTEDDQAVRALVRSPVVPLQDPAPALEQADAREAPAAAALRIVPGQASADAEPVPPPAEAAPPLLVQAEPLPPVHSDALLAPGDWILRIRARQQAGDRSGAVESLRLFRTRHPEIAIPDDIEPLLR